MKVTVRKVQPGWFHRVTRWIVGANAHGWWVIVEGAQTPIARDLREDDAYRLVDVLNAVYGIARFNLETVSKQQKEMEVYEEVLRECREYFDNKADAEHWPPVGNKEMTMLSRIDSILPRELLIAELGRPSRFPHFDDGEPRRSDYVDDEPDIDDDPDHHSLPDDCLPRFVSSDNDEGFA